jgi:hypothetical protein
VGFELRKISNRVLLSKSLLKSVDAYDCMTAVFVRGRGVPRDSLDEQFKQIVGLAFDITTEARNTSCVAHSFRVSSAGTAEGTLAPSNATWAGMPVTPGAMWGASVCLSG